MATAGASIGGPSFAEVYTLRKLHEEKMKKMKEEMAMGGVAASKEEKEKITGCFSFSGLFGKVHPTSFSNDHGETTNPS